MGHTLKRFNLGLILWLLGVLLPLMMSMQAAAPLPGSRSLEGHAQLIVTVAGIIFSAMGIAIIWSMCNGARIGREAEARALTHLGYGYAKAGALIIFGAVIWGAAWFLIPSHYLRAAENMLHLKLEVQLWNIGQLLLSGLLLYIPAALLDHWALSNLARIKGWDRLQ